MARTVTYSVVPRINPRDKELPPKYYAQAQARGDVNIREMAERIQSTCTVTKADVYAVLIASVESLLASLKAGKQVDFGELGKFRLQITSKGAVTAEEFTAANIKGVNIQFVPGDDLRTIFQDLQFNLVASRHAQAALLRAQKKGETTVDISKPAEDEGDEEA